VIGQGFSKDWFRRRGGRRRVQDLGRIPCVFIGM